MAQVSLVYSDFGHAASKSVRKRHLSRTSSKEGEPPTKFVKKVGAEEQEPAAAAAGASESKVPGPGGISAVGPARAGVVGHAFKAQLCISVYGNNGPKAAAIHFADGKRLGRQ